MKKISLKNHTHWLGAIAVLTVFVLIIYRRYAFTNMVIGRGDSYFYFYPYWTMATEAFREGRLPLWNPDLFMGTPLLANSQVGYFYPLNWPLWKFLEPPYAVTATIILHVLIAGLGTYHVAKKAFNLSFRASILAGVFFALSGFMTAQVEHVNQAQGLAYMPWLIAVCTGWASAVKSRQKLILKGGGIAFLFAMQLLAGHTQTTFITGIAVTVWTAYQLLFAVLDLWKERRDPVDIYPAEETFVPWSSAAIKVVATTTITAALGVGLAIAIASVQLLPTLELTGLSRRQEGLTLEEATSFSLHPALLVRALLPGYEQTQYAEYIAYLPLAGIMLAILGIATVAKKRWAWPALSNDCGKITGI